MLEHGIYVALWSLSLSLCVSVCFMRGLTISYFRYCILYYWSLPWWKDHELFKNRAWTVHAQFMNGSWTWNSPIHEKFMNISRHRVQELFMNISMHIVHEQFMNGSWTWNDPIHELFEVQSSGTVHEHFNAHGPWTVHEWFFNFLNMKWSYSLYNMHISVSDKLQTN